MDLGYSEAAGDVYALYRMLHGVGEGIDDLPPNVALPLEANLDYLNGVRYNHKATHTHTHTHTHTRRERDVWMG